PGRSRADGPARSRRVARAPPPRGRVAFRSWSAPPSDPNRPPPLEPNEPAPPMHLGSIELALLILVVATALSYLARRIGIAEPILFLLGGIALGFLPDLPDIELSPDLVFLVFLPPILFGAAYFTPIRDFK